MKRAYHFKLEAEKNMNKNYKRHDKFISIQRHRTKQLNKNQEGHEKFISLQKHTTKWLRDSNIYLNHTYVHTYTNPQTQSGYFAITKYYTVKKHRMGSDYEFIKYALLNLILVDKDNDVVIFNTKNNKEKTKIHICNHACVD